MAVKTHAFRFIHPDTDSFTAGLRFSPTGGITLADEIDSVRQAIMILLTTIPGERVMRPDYGCDLFRLIFSPNDDTAAGLAIYYVRRAIERWEPRIDITELDANPEPDSGQLMITMSYRIRESLRTDTILLPVSLEGETP